MNFLVDMPVSPDLAMWLKQLGHDAVHASQIGLDQADDKVIIRRAKQENRVVVTADLDFPRLLALTGADGPGIVLFRGGNYSEREMLELINRVLTSAPLEELPRSVTVVDKARIRRTKLPLEPKT